MTKSHVLTIIVVAVAVLLIVGMLLFYFLAVVPPRAPGVKTVTLEILYAGKEYRYEGLETTATTVAELLDAYNQELELGVVVDSGIYGSFLTSLKGTAQDESIGAYYNYERNGGYGLGIDVESIADGDVITFKYGVTEYDSEWNMVGFTLADGGDDSIASTPQNKTMVAFIAFCVIGGVAILATALYLIYNATKKQQAQ